MLEEHGWSPWETAETYEKALCNIPQFEHTDRAPCESQQNLLNPIEGKQHSDPVNPKITAIQYSY
jgi:hypothetical protein